MYWVSGRSCRSEPAAPAALASYVRSERNIAARARFRRTALDERITPLSQRRNVNVDPVVPPIDAAGIEAEIVAFIRRKRGTQLFHVHRLKYMIVVQNKWFEKRHELDHFFELALLAR